MNYHRKNIIESKDLNDLKNRLITEIGTMIKNKKFIDIAKNEGFLDSSKVKNYLEIWEEKINLLCFQRSFSTKHKCYG